MSNSWVFVSWFVEFFLIIWTKHEPQPVAVQQNKKIRQRVAGGWWGGMKAMVQQTEQSHFLALNLFLLYQLVWHNCMKNNKICEKARALQDTKVSQGDWSWHLLNLWVASPTSLRGRVWSEVYTYMASTTVSLIASSKPEITAVQKPWRWI